MLVIAVVIAVIIYGVYATVIAPPKQWLSMVNGTSITASDYSWALRLNPYISSIEDPLLILEDNELVRQGAAAVGLPHVTDDEITQEIKDMLFPEEEEIDEEAYRQFLDAIGLSDSEFREAVGVEVLKGKFEDYLKEQVPQSAEQVHVQAIIVANETAAQAVMDRLDAGEDFASLAEEYEGGDLGWLPRGIMSEDFDEVAFSIEMGNVSQPFSTAGGYYIIKVLEKEERALDETTREQLEANAFSSWLDEQREQKVVRNPDLDLDAIYQWALKQIS